MSTITSITHFDIPSSAVEEKNKKNLMLIRQSRRLLLFMKHNFFLLNVLRNKHSFARLLFGPKKHLFFRHSTTFG